MRKPHVNIDIMCEDYESLSRVPHPPAPDSDDTSLHLYKSAFTRVTQQQKNMQVATDSILKPGRA